MAAISSTSSTLIPLDLKRELPDPLIPWKISEPLFKDMQEDSNKLYKKALILPIYPEWKFLWRYFHQDKPNKYAFKRAYCVQDRHQLKAFEVNLSSIERDAEKFKPTWDKEPRSDQRAEAINQWKQATSSFSPLHSMEEDGRKRTWNHTKVLPLWHGSSNEKCKSICESGFTFFGKTSLGGASDETFKSTDEGFFGSGIYFTDSARYAADIYSSGHLMMAWISMREPFPVVGDPQQQDMKTLKGKGAYKNYNAHYVPVVPASSSMDCAIYYPCKKGEKPTCTEIVIFNSPQALPRFWIELEVEGLYLMSPSNIPQFVNQLIPHILKILEKPLIDEDQKLRNFLNKKLAILFKLQEDDDLEQEHETLFIQLTQLIDQTGKINKTIRQALTGVISSKNLIESPMSSLQQLPFSIPTKPESISTKEETTTTEGSKQKSTEIISENLIPMTSKKESLATPLEGLTKIITQMQTFPKTTFIMASQIQQSHSSSKEEMIPARNWEKIPEVRTLKHEVTALIELKDGSIASGSHDKTIKLWKRDGTCLATFKGNTHFEHYSAGTDALIELNDGTLACASFKEIKLLKRDGTCLATLMGHTSWIEFLNELKDGILASGSSDDTIKLWKLDGTCLATLTGHKGRVTVLVELKDRMLASGSWDKTIKLWKQDGTCLATFTGHQDYILTLIELKDGILASGSSDGTVKLWKRDGTCLATFTTGYKERVPTLIELKDSTLACVSNEKIQLWNRNGKRLATFAGHTKGIVTLIELSDGTLASGSWDNTIKLWKQDGTCITTLMDHADGIRALIELKDGTLASGSYDKTIRLWKFPEMLSSRSSQEHQMSFFNSSVQQSSISDSEMKIIQMNWKVEPLIQTFEGHNNIVCTLIELKDGTLASGSDDKTIKLWRRDGICISTFRGHKGSIISLIELKDGVLASASTDKTIKLWKRDSTCCTTIFMDAISTLIELKDGTLASRSKDNTIKLWKRDGTCLATFTGHKDFISTLIESKDGTLVSGSWDKTIKLWKRDGTCLATFKGFFQGHTDSVSALIELKDGTIASGSKDKTIKLWKRDGTCLATFTGHMGRIYILIELKDGTIASGSEDKTIKLWTRDGTCLATFTGHKDSIHPLLELKDGTIASGSADKTIKLWTRDGTCLTTLSDKEQNIRTLIELKNGGLACGLGDNSINLWTFPLLK